MAGTLSPHAEGHPCREWDGCAGFLIVELPCGHHVDVGHRASNCSKPDDKKHRCWVVESPLPNLTLGKNGDTCDAGQGSIICHCGWHGFVCNGQFVRAYP